MVGRSRGRLAATAAALALAAGVAPAARAADERPNVVVIETDDQTAESMWALPAVRRELADNGATFSNSFVSYALCCPSRATFLTGQYAHNHGVFSNRPPDGGYYKLHGDETLPVWLRRAGYRTILVGKYLNLYGTKDPTEVPPGWTDWHALVGQSWFHYFGFKMNDNGVVHKVASKPANYQTDFLTEKAVTRIQHAAGARKPFFMWLTYVAPHFANRRGLDIEPDDPPGLPTPTPAPRDRNLFAGEPLPVGPAFDERDLSDKPPTIRDLPALTRERRDAIQENYQQELETLQAVDRGVSRVLDTLRAAGTLNRTLVVFTSDNGYFHGEHRMMRGKELPYEPGIRVPLLMRGPGVPRGVTVDQLVSNQDLAPTILDVTGAKPGLPQDGISLMPIVADPAVDPGRDLLIEGQYSSKPHLRFAGVRTPRWLYAEYSSGDRELYDLETDPDETTNRAGDADYADVESDLGARLAALRDCAGASCQTRSGSAAAFAQRR